MADDALRRRPTLLQAVFMGKREDVAVMLRGSSPAVDINEVDPQNKRNALHMAAQNGDLAMARLLLDHRIAVDAIDKSGWLPIHHAANNGSNAVLLELIKRGSDVNAVTKNTSGLTPLHLAATVGKHATAKILVQHNADVAQCDRQKRPPLYTAVRWGHAKVVALLLAYGAQPTPDINAALDLCPKDDSKAEISRLLHDGVSAAEAAEQRAPYNEASVIADSQMQYDQVMRGRAESRESARLTSAVVAGGEVGSPTTSSHAAALTSPSRQSEALSSPMSQTTLRQSIHASAAQSTEPKANSGGCCVLL